MRPLGSDVWKEPPPEQFEPLLHLSPEGISQLVLWLLIEETLRGRLSAFRPQNFPPQPAECLGEFVVGGPDVVPVGDASR